MGRATRWFKSLFGFTTPRRDKDCPNRDGTTIDRDLASLFGNPPLIPPNISTAEAAWLRSFFSEKEDEDREQSRRAIAVAVASAAAADAAAKAAVAAAAVARLTGRSRGGGGGLSAVLFGFSPKERSAAVMIQTLFRGFLARKALRALKGLVKLQALVRGFLVRKRATAALRSIQALMRVQDAARLRRSRRISDNECPVHDGDNQSRRSLERFGEQPTPVHSSRRTLPIDSSPRKDNPRILEVDGLFTRPKSSCSQRTTTTSAPMPESFHPNLSSPLTPRFSKSYDICYYNECYDTWEDDRLGRLPGYMAKTLSFRAKWRSQSAPRQRQRTEAERGPRSMGTIRESSPGRGTKLGP
ncbi:hypothetical protein MLD38_014320 [Melastoma candidum]|uniref:Uncharacterized protein n=1 Tax=Melastoma candidum TaxID=119954 RepID=A0ACB9RCG4_9MYRT|nr:hypothetical protein MLD38_014320 [Melastoma candidum]